MQKVENVFVLRPSGLIINLIEPLKMKSFKQEHRAKVSSFVSIIVDCFQHRMA